MNKRAAIELEKIGEALANVPAFNLENERTRTAAAKKLEEIPDVLKILIEEYSKGMFANYKGIQARMKELVGE